MYRQVETLNLPKGIWQEIFKSILNPIEAKVICEYPVSRTLCMLAYDSNDEEICRFSLSLTPGCYALLVSHATSVSPKYRGQGLATKMHMIKQIIAADLNAAGFICTVKEDNEAQKRVMLKQATTVTNFINPTNDNKIGLWFVPSKLLN